MLGILGSAGQAGPEIPTHMPSSVSNYFHPQVATLQADFTLGSTVRCRWQRSGNNSSQRFGAPCFVAGIRLSTAIYFLLRGMSDEMCCQDRCLATCSTSPHALCLQDKVPLSRVQKRAIHYLSQRAEEHVLSQSEDAMPTPCASHEFHPCKK